ncbi:ArsR family transcriptional regulator [Halobacteriales archaeon QS_8_65_32]|nr:MAG: ArsR family transcriptional regulator [Halobacteriales archaeon QS_8_65_32]
MSTPDETDLEILALLTANARRPYREIADLVGLSAPAVSNRIDRLGELGVIRGFTVDVDRSQLREGISVLFDLDLAVEFDAIDAVRTTLAETEGVGHVFTTAEGHVLFEASVPNGNVREWLSATIDTDRIAGYDVRLLTDVDWTPDVAGTEFALNCVECDNTVTSEGTVTRIDGDLYQFCCPSCESRFTDRYETFREAPEG